ncbi:MAG TPA: WecB/TagA/CpsF family glycosyltransferase [Solirubrobacterales bacterium]|jgi:N-acetylglucosaminyldiphosphoundecaprenol N-acetyl-beta-D-mannosaminyltransferase
MHGDQTASDAGRGPVDVLGVRVTPLTRAQLLDRVSDWARTGTRRYVTFTSVHGVMESQRHADVMAAHNSVSAVVVPDGMPLVWAARRAGARSAERLYGPDVMLAICERAAAEGLSSFFYGGAPGVAERVAERLGERFPGLRVAGTYTPPFRELTQAEREEVLARIDASGADLVWVGISTPKQERWMAAHLHLLERPCVMFGVGAAFDIHAGLQRDAPAWIKETGFQWLYRLIREPRRLWRRYLRNNPAFVYAIARRPPRLLDRPEAGAASAAAPLRGDALAE